MKTAISIPDQIFDAADELADRLGVSRSALYSRAVEEFLEKHREDRVTEKLNEVHGAASSALDPVLRTMQAETIAEDDW